MSLPIEKLVSGTDLEGVTLTILHLPTLKMNVTLTIPHLPLSSIALLWRRKQVLMG